MKKFKVPIRSHLEAELILGILTELKVPPYWSHHRDTLRSYCNFTNPAFSWRGRCVVVDFELGYRVLRVSSKIPKTFRPLNKLFFEHTHGSPDG